MTNKATQKRTDIDIKHFEKVLLDEKVELEEKLARLGRVNPDNPDDWEPVQDEMVVNESDPNEVADKMEEYEISTAVLKEVETRYNLVLLALKKVTEGTYGIDEVDGDPIPIERLNANPAARTKMENVYKVQDKLI